MALGLTRSIHGLERVPDEALRAADCAGHVESPIEAPEIFRRLEGFLERGLGETERRREALELARIDFLHYAHHYTSMPKSRDRSSALEPIRRVSQIRQYSADPVPDDVIDQLLELARWTGSAKNSQPWRFIVVRDKDRLKKLGALRPPIGWLASAPLGIAIVLDGAEGMFGAYDEGRLTERLLTGATMLGYGGGTAWFGGPTQDAEAKKILGVPENLTARQIVMIGRPTSNKDPRPSGPMRGRKPIAELVSYDRWGASKRK